MPVQHPAGTANRPTTVENRTSHQLGESSHDTYGVETRWLATLESMIERYPWPTLLLALGLGYLLSRRMR
ncbi:MAG TPA: hypothetical protein VJL88_01390 [Nitrospira sp.]|nr:hypothetical protein [Nitrospira sp.]